MKNRLIIFDCFGVIFSEVAPVFLRRHLPAESVDEIKDKLFIPADLGEVTYDELLKNISDELGIPLEDVIPEWESLFVLDEKMVSVIRCLKKENDIALLSNAPLGLVEKLIEEYSLSDLFDKVFISCNLHLAKPDAEIFRHCVSSFGKDYDAIYMIDDSIKNLEHLPSLNIIPIHYKNIEGMLDELNR